MTRSRISVAMCTYNGSRYLWDQLQSIASQSRRPDELVVCDDGSTDGTVDLLSRFAAESLFPVRIFSNARTLRTAKNFERAITLCDGEIIALSDQDDIWKPEKLQRLSTILEQNPRASYVFSDAELVDERGNSLKISNADAHRWKRIARRFDRAEQLELLLRQNLVTGSAMAFRASLKDIILPISRHWMHDYWIAILGSTFGYGISIPDRLFSYRIHPTQQVMGFRKRRERFFELDTGSLLTTRRQDLKKVIAFRKFHERVKWAMARYGASQRNLSLIQAKEAHLRRRAALRSSKGIFRLAMLLSEVFTGRYWRFSRAWRSIGRDLFPSQSRN